MVASNNSGWIDASNHNPVTQAVLTEAGARGVKGVCFNLLDLYGFGGLNYQLALVSSMGFRIAGYVYLNFPGGAYYTGEPAHNQVFNKVKAVVDAGFKLEWVAIDCEDPGNTLDTANTSEFISDAVAAVTYHLIPAWIYTAEYWWRDHTGNTNRFAHIPLWNATDDKQPDLNSVNYGGWTTPVMEQYNLHGIIQGTEYDFNTKYESLTLEYRKLNNTEAIESIYAILSDMSSIIGNQDNKFIGLVTSPSTPAGYVDRIIRTKV